MNLLVGINGSGKTSVLNVIDWLLRPNIPRLSTTQFERIALHFEHNKANLILEAIQSERELNIYLKGHGRRLHPFNVILKRSTAKIGNDQELEQLLEHYSGLRAEPKERPLWEALRRIPKPVVIALDRTISAEAEDTIYTEPDSLVISVGATRTGKVRARSPLSKVREVTSSLYSKYRSKVIELNDELKAKIVISALRDPVSRGNRGRPGPKITLREIDKLEQKVTEYLSTAIQGDNVNAQIQRYFRRVRMLSADTQSISVTKHSRAIFLGIFSNQYQQIEDLAQAFDDFEKKCANAFEPLKRYLDIVNVFFQDSCKQILFQETTNQLGFKFLKSGNDKSRNTLFGDFRGIEHLSSGERQVIILFTFLAFVADEQRLFIVDEPELSLHPKWQSEFIDAFLKLKPRSTQLLLATHSPDVVGGHKEACIVLRP